MRSTLTFYLLFLITLFCPLLVSGQVIQTYGSNSGAAGVPVSYINMIQGLFGNGVQIQNVIVNCDTLTPYVGNGQLAGQSPQMGWFVGPGTNIPLTNGLLMTSGNIGSVAQTNTIGSTGIITTANLQDPDLEIVAGLTPGSSRDACRIEFDIYPLCDTLGIQYIFGSEEYMEFVGSINDAFGFFLTGPNPIGPAYANTNIATLPIAGQPPVTIASVNCNTNGAFYQCNEPNPPGTCAVNCPPNGAATSIMYDGLTVALWARARVFPCQWYHVKLAVADMSDQVWDSGVLLQAGGITCLGGSSVNITAVNVNNPTQSIAEEGCSGVTVTFDAGIPVTSAITINLATGGTATNSVDYPAIAPSITIPVGASTASLTINPFSDAIPEGTETVFIYCTYSACGGTITDTVTFNIIDPVTVDAGPDITTCSDVLTPIGVLPGPGSTVVGWNWTPAGNLINAQTPTPSANVSLPAGGSPVTTTYTLTGTDLLGCTATDQMNLTVIPSPAAAIAMQDTVCVGLPAGATYAGTPLIAGGSYTWTFGNALGGAQGLPNQTLSWLAPNLGNQVVSLIVQNGNCISQPATKDIFVRDLPSSNFSITPSACMGQTITVSYIGGAPMTSNFIWAFPGASNVLPLANQSYQVTYPAPGTYNVSLTVNQAGCVGNTTTKPTTIFPNPTSTFSYPTNICVNDSNSVVYTGTASPFAVYQWDFGDAVVISGSGPGPYTMSWTTPSSQNIHRICLVVSESGCTSDTNCVFVNVYPKPVASFTPIPDTACFIGNNISFIYTGTPGANSYSWNFGSSATPPTMLNVANPQNIQYLNDGLKTVSLVVTQNGCKSDTAKRDVLIIPQPSANFNASSSNVCLNGCITFTYTGSPVYAGQAYSWDFGAGASPQFSTLVNPGCVQYTTPGFKTVTLTVDLFGCIETKTIQIFVGNGNPQVSAGADTSLCQGAAPIELQGMVVFGTGTPAYGYSWWCSNPPLCGIDSVNVLKPQVNPGSSPMTYYFQVTDAIGCVSNVDSVVVTVKPRPLVNAGPDKSICGDPNSFGVFLNGSVTNSAQCPGPYTYSWTCNLAPNCGMNPGQEILEDPYVRPLQTTIYTLIVTAANGCSSLVNTLDTASTVTVTVVPQPPVEAGTYKEICFGQSVQMNGFGGTGPACTFQWTPNTPIAGVQNATNPTTFVTPQQTTTYTLSVTCNGCTSSDTVTVKVNTLPTGAIEPPVWDMCQGESLQLQGFADGDPFGNVYSYSWSPSTGLSNPNIANPICTADTTTTYQLFVKTALCEGFFDNITVTVKPTPIVSISTPDTTICYGEKMILFSSHVFAGTVPATPIIYSWSPASGNIQSPNQDDTWVAPTQTTTYTVSCTVAGGCGTTDQVTVYVTPKIEAQATTDKDMICDEGFVTLTASGGANGPYTYTWSPTNSLSNPFGQTTIATPSITTTYYLTVNENGCTGNDSITINVLPQPDLNYGTSNTKGCVPLEVGFFDNSTDALGYVWNFGDGSPISNQPIVTHTYTTPGTYTATYTVIGSGGCVASVQISNIEVADTSFADFTSNPPIDSILYLPNHEVQFTDLSPNSVAWWWNFGDGTYSGEQNPVHTYRNPGEYSVSLAVTNENGCTSHITKFPYKVLPPGLFVPNTFTPNGDGIHDTFGVNYDGTESFLMSIYDRWNNTVFSTNNPSEQWDGKDLRGKEVSDGTYYYSLKIGNKVYSGHVLLVK